MIHLSLAYINRLKYQALGPNQNNSCEIQALERPHIQQNARKFMSKVQAKLGWVRPVTWTVQCPGTVMVEWFHFALSLWECNVTKGYLGDSSPSEARLENITPHLQRLWSQASRHWKWFMKAYTHSGDLTAKKVVKGPSAAEANVESIVKYRNGSVLLSARVRHWIHNPWSAHVAIICVRLVCLRFWLMLPHGILMVWLLLLTSMDIQK